MKVLKSVINIIENSNLNVATGGSANNRLQNVGEGLELYVKNSFCNTFNEESNEVRNQLHSDFFSYGGGTNNPPDMVVKNGEAIEVKKITGYGRIPLNSSFPKDLLYRNDPLITQECSSIDGANWDSKNMFNYIGTVNDDRLECLFIIEGKCYCASKEKYSRIKNIIKSGVGLIPNVEFGETKELGRVNKVDPLGITNLRIRGMWDIQHPINVLSEQINDNLIEKGNNNLSVMYIVLLTKTYNSASTEDKIAINELINQNKIEMYDKRIKDPNNTANLIDIKLLKVKL